VVQEREPRGNAIDDVLRNIFGGNNR